jgi:hypothetical protein
MNTNKLIGLAAFGILAVLWAGFGAALILKPTALDEVWGAFRGLPLVLQLVVGLLLLPLVLGLAAWEAAWPIWLRLVLVVGLGLATLVTFYPWRTQPDAGSPALSDTVIKGGRQ